MMGTEPSECLDNLILAQASGHISFEWSTAVTQTMVAEVRQVLLVQIEFQEVHDFKIPSQLPACIANDCIAVA